MKWGATFWAGIILSWGIEKAYVGFVPFYCFSALVLLVLVVLKAEVFGQCVYQVAEFCRRFCKAKTRVVKS